MAPLVAKIVSSEQYVVRVDTTSVEVTVLNPVLKSSPALPWGTFVSAAAAVTVSICVNVQGQSVIVKAVAFVTVYVTPLVLKVVGFGQYVVNSVTTSIEVITAVEAGAAVSVSESELKFAAPLACAAAVSSVDAVTVFLRVKVHGQSVIVKVVASVTV